MATADRLRVLSWNIRAITGISADRLSRVMNAIVSHPVDVVLLQEVCSEGDLPERLRDLFKQTLGFECWHSGGTFDKRYGNVVASRFSVTPIKSAAPSLPWPHLLARATIATPVRSVEVVSAHIPNGSKYGWQKIDTLEALGEILVHGYDTPRILGGDFNEPEGVGPDNAIHSAQVAKDGSVFGQWRDRYGRQDSCWRWQAAVDHVLGPKSILAHAWLSRNRGTKAITHVVRSKRCFFDHLLASRDHFRILAADYHHEWRRKGSAISDHSAACAVVGWR